MTRLRGRSRAVYQVYGEEEYLAGTDALPAWDGPPSDEPKHGRRLQRIAGAAALTGAVGTVWGVIGLAELRARAIDRRELAQRVVSPIRAAALPRHMSAPAHLARRQIPHPSSPRRTHAHRRTQTRVSPGLVSRSETPARVIAVSSPPASTAQQVPAEEAHAGPRAQSEFGFER